jgi:hypothetical protein
MVGDDLVKRIIAIAVRTLRIDCHVNVLALEHIYVVHYTVHDVAGYDRPLTPILSQGASHFVSYVFKGNRRSDCSDSFEVRLIRP